MELPPYTLPVTITVPVDPLLMPYIVLPVTLSGLPSTLPATRMAPVDKFATPEQLFTPPVIFPVMFIIPLPMLEIPLACD